MATAIATRYAHALADVVLEPGSAIEPGDAAGQLSAMQAAFAESSELRSIMLHPSVTPAEKRAVITKIADALGLNLLLKNFIYVLIDRRRIGYLDEVRQAFEDTLDERMGVVRADVTSASGLAEQQRAGLKEALAGLTGKQVRCKYDVDEGLLGGAVVQLGSTVYNGSISGKLEALRKRLTD